MKTKYLTLILLLTCGIGRAQNGTTVWDAQGNYRCPAAESCPMPSLAEIAQHKPKYPASGAVSLVGNDSMTSGTIPLWNPSPTPAWFEQVKDGTYTATFSDPGNLWRCYMTSVTLDDPRNVFGSEASTLTITCVKSHPVTP